jgi:hypothetical protein
MKDKYERALIYIGETVVWKLHEHAPKNAIIHDCFPEQFELLKELVDKETELQSRKDKLVLGSEWVCVANNTVAQGINFDNIYKGDLIVIDGIVINLVALKLVDEDEDRSGEFVIDEDQFLLCFKPR